MSLAAFSVWAWGDRAFRHLGGDPVMYAAIAAVFLALTGLLLHPLLDGPGTIARFYRLFVPGFFAYALLWSAFWFWLGPGLGEWLGVSLGGAALVAVCARTVGGGTPRAWALAWAGFLLFHSAGYYAGGWSTHQLMTLARNGGFLGLSRGTGMNLAKWSWGLGYGLGFGAGFGWILDCLRPTRPR